MQNIDSLEEDHYRYRILSKELVDDLIEHGMTPATDKRVRMYQSQDAFEQAFPDAISRREMLNALEENLRALQAALKRIKRATPDFFSV